MSQVPERLEAIKNYILSKENGWSLLDIRVKGNCFFIVLSKMVKTIVADKEALIQMYNSSEGQCVVQGVYQSEGRNVLGPSITIVKDNDSIEDVLDKFLEGVDRCIDESYARSLFLNRTKS